MQLVADMVLYCMYLLGILLSEFFSNDVSAAAVASPDLTKKSKILAAADLLAFQVR